MCDKQRVSYEQCQCNKLRPVTWGTLGGSKPTATETRKRIDSRLCSCESLIIEGLPFWQPCLFPSPFISQGAMPCFTNSSTRTKVVESRRWQSTDLGKLGYGLD